MKSSVETLSVNIHEMKHAFNVNGVTFSRKKLAELFPSWGDSLESFYRFLCIAPFLSETKEVEDAPSSVGKYAIFKAKRIQKALNLYEDMIPAFMVMAAKMGNLEDDHIGEISDQCHDQVCNCGKKKGVPSAHAGKTLH